MDNIEFIRAVAEASALRAIELYASKFPRVTEVSQVEAATNNGEYHGSSRLQIM